MGKHVVALDQEVETLLNAGDWDAAIELFAPDVVRVDRRSGISSETIVGRDELLASFRTFVELGLKSAAIAPIEIRGEGLDLVHIELLFENDYQIEWLQVSELDTQSRYSHLVYYDVDHREAALAELEQRHLAARPRVPPIAGSGIPALSCSYRAILTESSPHEVGAGSWEF